MGLYENDVTHISFSVFPIVRLHMASFPTLFGESSHGKRKMWSVSVEDRSSIGVVITTHGYEDGKKVVNERLVTVGKNIGKKNATTPVTQAISEAQALWNKKRDAGYAPEGSTETATTTTTTTDAVVSVAVDSSSTTKACGAGAPDTGASCTPLPMLAQDYNKRGKDIVFPCFAQRKLDGVRCVAISGKGIFSRNGKAFPHMEHIKLEINTLPAGTILDGELYSDTLSFQEIVGLVKKETLIADDAARSAKIYLCVYDTIRDGTNAERNEWLTKLFAANTFSALRLLHTDTCDSIEELKRLHAKYVEEGYEGLILRNRGGLYKVGHRSKDLQKYKEFSDSEYVVTGFKEGDGVEKGCVIWICKTPAGQEFAVRPRGTHEDRIALFARGASMIGRHLTVRYQELTTDGIPRFPVGIAFRDYE